MVRPFQIIWRSTIDILICEDRTAKSGSEPDRQRVADNSALRDETKLQRVANGSPDFQLDSRLDSQILAREKRYA
jgi:hypothetical protein